MEHLVVFVVSYPHNVCEILALKTHAEEVLLLEKQFFLDVVYHAGRGGGSEGEDGNVRNQFADIGNLQICRAEVIPPLADAVCFIDSDEADFHASDFYLKQFGCQSFGRDV